MVYGILCTRIPYALPAPKYMYLCVLAVLIRTLNAKLLTCFVPFCCLGAIQSLVVRQTQSSKIPTFKFRTL